MSKDEIFDKIEDILIHEGLMTCSMHEVKLEDTRESLGLDSLDEVEFLVCVEEQFHIEIADEEAQACATVGDFVALVERKLKPCQNS